MSLARLSLIAFCFIWLIACGGDPGDEGGLIGTGIIAGTVSETKVLASERIEVKASSGEKYEKPLNRSRQFYVDEAEGEAPRLLRTDLGNGEYRYAIAYDRSRSNIHSYSDVVLRSWYASNNRDLASEFESGNALPGLPTQQQFDDASRRILSVVERVLADYGFSGDQLFSADYPANDNGIDNYLDKNPVIISGDNVSVLLTDPNSGLQSKTRSTLSLSLPSTAADTISPRKVTGVRAFGSGLSEMVIIWEPAQDNVGVAAYQVERDNIFLATTPYPVFTDTGLQSGTTYGYKITAVDGSGNEAFASEEVIGTTLADVDSQPPPTPTSVIASEVSSNRVIVRWTQSSIGDVVSFDVYRNAGGAPFEPYLRTTTSELVDPSVSGGTQYCYLIRAVDASGNSSDFTEELCVNTNGEVVSTSDGSTIGGLSVPVINTADCAAMWNDASPIVTDVIMSEPCYRVTTDINVGQFGDLVIDAGTILIFSQGLGITVSEDGSLATKGTEQDPVVLTGLEDRPGFWRGVTYNKSDSTDNQIVNTVIEYAGGAGQFAALDVKSTFGSRSRLRVEGSIIRFNDGYGFGLPSVGTRIDVFSGNLVTENERVAFVGPLLLQSIGTDNDFSGNLLQVIGVGSLGIDEPMVIPNLGDVEIRINGIEIQQADLTIEAGVEIKFLENKWLEIDGGNLQINGTVEEPVLLTSSVRGAGNWGGVHLFNSPNSRLENVTIEFGGAPVLQHNANLTLSNSAASLVNVTLRDSSALGIYTDADSVLTGTPVLINNAQ